MTEEAPPPQAQSLQLDDDLISYEADDFDAAIDVAEAAKDVTSSKMNISQPSETVHEIDWEDHDKIGDSVEINGDEVGLDAGTSLPTDDANAASFDVDINGALPADDGVAGDDATFNDLDVNLVDGEDDGTDEADGQEVEHEIDYEEEEEEEDVEVVSAPAKQGAEEDLIDYESFPDDPAVEAETGGAVENEEVEDGSEYQAQDVNDVNLASAGNQSEEQSEEEEGSPGDDGECPDIAVTYHNEEFPLFHGQKNFEGQDGFFHDQSILDITMDHLLRKFRAELGSDLRPQDELVLQIDEMGLEYAESTARDHCASVTLRQVHEIFEQLSQNQDPDATRTLYTNLIIRPHPAKRLDYLINEAFNGKGLDEVVYSFSHQASKPAAEQDVDIDMYGGDSSEVDDDGDGSGGQEDEMDDEVQELDVQEDEDPASNVGFEENAENEHDDGDQDDVDQDDIVDDMVDLDDDTPAVAMQDLGEQDDFDGSENGLDTMSQPPTALAPDNAFEDTDFQADQAADIGADGNDGDENAGFDLLDFPDEEATVPEPDHADKGNTSATATLNGDGENEISYEDDGIDVADVSNAAGAVVAADGVDGDEVQEIDWRDDPDDDVGASLDANMSSKRPHSEVEVDFGLDDENDVKRRRS